MHESGLDEVDLKVIHALQIEPRISWVALARALGSDPATVARRWARIRDRGYAWQTAMSGGWTANSTAIVEVSCAPGETLRAAEWAANDTNIISIDVTSGRRDLVLTFDAPNDEVLADYAITRFGQIPGVRSVQAHIINSTFRLGSSWSVSALSDAELRLIPPPRAPRPTSARLVDPAVATRIRRLLESDVRASFEQIGAALSISAQRAADYIARLREQGQLELRTDVAGPHSGWPIVSWYFVQAPTRTIEAAAALLPQLPEVQLAVAVTGPHNLLIASCARSRSEVLTREAELERQLPGARIADRSTVLRMYKHLGQLIGADGLATGKRVALP